MARTTRREALRRIATVATAPFWVDRLLAISDQHAAHRAAAGVAAQGAAWTPRVLNAHQNELVIAMSELIIPATETPGATAAHVNRYIDGVLADATPEDRDGFLQGLAWLDMRSEARFSRQFVNASPDQQIELLTALSAAAAPATGVAPGAVASSSPSPGRPQVAPEDRPGVEVFRALKAMTVAGYYSSEVGLMQEIGDPGPVFATEFKGCTHREHGAN